MKKSAAPWIALGVFLLVVWIISWLTIALFVWESSSYNTAHKEGGDHFSVRFGILGVNSSGDYFLEQETATIPLKYKDSGFRYGLEIVPPDDESFTYQCVFHFSAAPKVLTGEAFENSVPSATLRTPKVEYKGTAIEYYWFDPGDPTGAQSVDIFVNDKLIKTINYTVVTEK